MNKYINQKKCADAQQDMVNHGSSTRHLALPRRNHDNALQSASAEFSARDLIM